MSKWQDIAEGKIATVVTEHQLAITPGVNGGVQQDDVVTLFRYVEVRDPSTGEQLGRVRVPRLNLKVTSVHAKFALANVTDRVPSTGSVFDAAKVRPLKRVTDDKWADEKDDLILVSVGEEVSIRRDLDPPPF